MLEDFIHFVQKENLFQPDQKILIAVSGGIDSIVLSKLFSLAKFNFGIAHVNFSLRGEESLADEVFVKKFAKTFKVPYHTICFDTNAFAAQEKISTQMAARILRYQWFEEIRVKEGYDFIATGHHLLDSAETMLINLVRGTGIAGFHGIPIKSGNLIRPLSFASQDDIFDFVVSHKLAWREDSSNGSTKYQRNFIRHEIMPKFQELNANFEQSLASTSQKIKGIEAWMQAELQAFVDDFCTSDTTGNTTITIPPTSPKITVILTELLLRYHFNSTSIEAILKADKVGAIFESPSHILNIDRGQWIVSLKSQADFKPIVISEDDEVIQLGTQELHIFIEERTADWKAITDPNVACLDADTLDFPLEIRKVQDGDWFCPLGMNQKKLISDFLTDKKVPLAIKKNTQILLSKGSVAWILGQRIDNRNKVTDKTELVAVFELKDLKTTI
ncbi:tRNA lysidine(34) synthetase TilS [Aquirufa sp. HETE-83D]|uniref:tRNA(Ile)-lysidine synthase n=1 Tax=Aquirufa esocilacus TaxID=3096513 RepID=A0ABW6DKX1_9BACT